MLQGLMIINAPLHVMIHDNGLTYDLILGLDFLCLVGINLLNDGSLIQWGNNTQPYQLHSIYLERNIYAQTIEVFAYDDAKDDPKGLGYKSRIIMDAKYAAIDTNNVAAQQMQLLATQHKQLANLLTKFPCLFDGKLCMYPHCKYHLNLKDNAQPVHSPPYRIPVSSQEAFKKELQHLVDIGVLEPIGATKWASPTFIILKKDSQVRWMSDFWALK